MNIYTKLVPVSLRRNGLVILWTTFMIITSYLMLVLLLCVVLRPQTTAAWLLENHEFMALVFTAWLCVACLGGLLIGLYHKASAVNCGIGTIMILVLLVKLIFILTGVR